MPTLLLLLAHIQEFLSKPGGGGCVIQILSGKHVQKIIFPPVAHTNPQLKEKANEAAGPAECVEKSPPRFLFQVIINDCGTCILALQNQATILTHLNIVLKLLMVTKVNNAKN